MRDIVPAILEKDFGEIKNKLTFLRGRAKCVQLDFCDGVFVKTATWPFYAKATKGAAFLDYNFQKILNEEEGLPFWEDFDFEFDLMVADAYKDFDIYLKLGPKRMIFHLDAQKNLEDFENFLESLDMYIRDNVEIGLAFKPNDDLEVVSKLSHKVDFLQCMGIDEDGFQGEKFDKKVLENIKFLKNNLPGIIISVDGGVNLQNAEEILAAGADRLTVGSGIWRSGDPIGALQDFQGLI
jgi:ribulose-phosphate 3-epimerase